MNTMLRKLSLFSYTFVLMNWAAVAGLFHFMRGSAGSWDSDEHLRLRKTDSCAVDWAGFSEHNNCHTPSKSSSTTNCPVTQGSVPLLFLQELLMKENRIRADVPAVERTS
jgi:hypothetical protein